MFIWEKKDKKRKRGTENIELTFKKDRDIASIKTIKTFKTLHSTYLINIIEIVKVYENFDMYDLTSTYYINEKDELNYYCIPTIVNKYTDYHIIFYWINELLYIYDLIDKFKQLQKIFKYVNWCNVFKNFIGRQLLHMYTTNLEPRCIILDTCVFQEQSKQTKSLVRISKFGSDVLCTFNSNDDNYILSIVTKLQRKVIQKYFLRQL